MKRTALLLAMLAILIFPVVVSAQYADMPNMTESMGPAQQMDGASVTIADFAFQPSMIVVQVGGTVTWYNAGGVTHTVTSDSGAFDSGNLAPGQSFSMTFSTPGTYSYHCAIHPGMTGMIRVVGMP